MAVALRSMPDLAPEELGWTLFGTAIGDIGIAWGVGGIVCVQLPEGGPERTRQRVAQRFPRAIERSPPPMVQRAIDGMTALIAGEECDLWPAILDMDGIPAFERRVYAVTRTIPAGRTITYGEIARHLEEPGSARAVGVALGRNPFAIVVPCHRVLAANGKAGGFSARGGITTKLRLLTIERARTSSAPPLFDDLPLMAAPARR